MSLPSLSLFGSAVQILIVIGGVALVFGAMGFFRNSDSKIKQLENKLAERELRIKELEQQ